MQPIVNYVQWKALTESGNHPVNEQLDGLDDLLHIGVDVISAIADSVVPGSGAAIDLIHAIEYFLQAHFEKLESNRVALNISGMITLASIAAIGPLQAAATALKQEVKIVFDAFKQGASRTTINLAKKSVNSASSHITAIMNQIAPLAKWLGTKIKELSNTGLGSWLMSKFGSIATALTKIDSFLRVGVPSAFTSFLNMLAKLNPVKIGAAGEEGAELALKQAAKEYAVSKAKFTSGQAVADATVKGDQEKQKVQVARPKKG